MSDPLDTESARVQLRVWLARREMTQDALATALGVTAAYLSRVVTGRVQCSERLAGRIEDLTGVPASCWPRIITTEEERAS